MSDEYRMSEPLTNHNTIHGELATLKDREKKLVEALKFYADHQSWNHRSNVLGYQRIISSDVGETTWSEDPHTVTGNIGGKRAREVLKELGVE